MRKQLFFLFFVFAFFILEDAKAQIKLHEDGHVSLGSLTKDYGIQIQPDGYSCFHTRYNNEWSWAILSYANDSLQKHWIVANIDDPNPGRHTFFVTGHGYVYKNGTLQMSDARFQHEEQQIEGARNVYSPRKRRNQKQISSKSWRFCPRSGESFSRSSGC